MGIVNASPKFPAWQHSIEPRLQALQTFMEPKLSFIYINSCLDKASFINSIKFLLLANTFSLHAVIICQ